MATPKHKRTLLTEKAFIQMKINAGLITEAEAEKLQEEADEAAENTEVVEESSEFELKDPKKPKEDPSTKDAKGTDKVAKSIKGGPSAKLEKVAKPTFNLKEAFGEEEVPPDLDGGKPPAPQTPPAPSPDMGGSPDMGMGGEDDKLTVDAGEFAQDLAAGISQALQAHFGNKLSVTSDGAAPAPAGDLGSQGGEQFEPIPENEMGEGGGGMPPDLGGGAPAPSPETPEEDPAMREAKKAKAVSTMVEAIMKKILSK